MSTSAAQAAQANEQRKATEPHTRVGTPTSEPANWRGICLFCSPSSAVLDVLQVVVAVLLFAIYLLLVIALPIMLSAAIGFRALPRGRACPHCAQETLPIVSRALRVLRLMVPAITLQRRWCPACLWSGYARSAALVPAAMPSTAVATRHTQLVRTLQLGGRSWSVMLEYWGERGRCYGRLLFVGPSGRLWCDPLAAFHGQTQRHVLEQAHALSDRLLAYRLREVISG